MNTVEYLTLSIGDIYLSLQCRPKSDAILHLIDRYCRMFTVSDAMKIHNNVRHIVCLHL